MVLYPGFCGMGQVGMGQVGMATAVASLQVGLEVGHILHLVKVLLRRSQQPASSVA